MTRPQPKPGSWTLNLFRKWKPFLSFGSIWRIRALSLRDKEEKLTREGRVSLQVLQPFKARIEIREWGTDLDTLDEVLQQEVYSQLSEHLKDCRTIVDLGANIGLASLYFSSKFPGSRIISVEAHPDNFSLLEKNVSELAASGRCSPLLAAIWSSSGARLVFSAPNSLAFSGITVGAAGGADWKNESTTSITMPDLMKRFELSFVDLLKVDIEGAETELLRGDTSWLERVGAIAIEFHGNSRNHSNFDAIIKSFGFSVIASTPLTTVAGRR